MENSESSSELVDSRVILGATDMTLMALCGMLVDCINEVEAPSFLEVSASKLEVIDRLPETSW